MDDEQKEILIELQKLDDMIHYIENIQLVYLKEKRDQLKVTTMSFPKPNSMIDVVTDTKVIQKRLDSHDSPKQAPYDVSVGFYEATVSLNDVSKDLTISPSSTDKSVDIFTIGNICTFRNLRPNSKYSFRIDLLVVGKIWTNTKVTYHIPVHTKQLPIISLKKPILMFENSELTVNLAWEAEVPSKYRIMRNDVLLTQVDTTTYVYSTNVRNFIGCTISYQIVDLNNKDISSKLETITINEEYVATVTPLSEIVSTGSELRLVIKLANQFGFPVNITKSLLRNVRVIPDMIQSIGMGEIVYTYKAIRKGHLVISVMYGSITWHNQNILVKANKLFKCDFEMKPTNLCVNQYFEYVFTPKDEFDNVLDEPVDFGVEFDGLQDVSLSSVDGGKYVIIGSTGTQVSAYRLKISHQSIIYKELNGMLDCGPISLDLAVIKYASKEFNVNEKIACRVALFDEFGNEMTRPARQISIRLKDSLKEIAWKWNQDIELTLKCETPGKKVIVLTCD
jgi:hypothetical protein